MPVYARKTLSSHQIFHNRETIITTGRGLGGHTEIIPIPDDVTLCNGCNQNIEEDYLIYLGKRELKADQPYDYYCERCLKSYFKGAVIVS
jgi:hypothetical protein